VTGSLCVIFKRATADPSKQGVRSGSFCRRHKKSAYDRNRSDRTAAYEVSEPGASIERRRRGASRLFGYDPVQASCPVEVLADVLKSQFRSEEIPLHRVELFSHRS
jgi:hypothetical protein